MDVEQAIAILEKLSNQDSSNLNLSDIQEKVFRECWSKKSYQEIADLCGYDPDYIKQIGAKLWRSLSKVLNKKVTKGNLHRIFRQLQQEISSRPN